VPRLPIRAKVAAALAIPLIVLVTVAMVEVVRIGSEVDRVRQQAAAVKAATGPNGLFNALQDERNRAASSVVSLTLLELPCEDNGACRAETDRSLETLAAQIEADGPAIQEAYAPAFAELARLDEVRDFVDSLTPGGLSENQHLARLVFLDYSVIIDSLLEGNGSVVRAIDNPDLRRGAELSHTASRNMDLLAHTVEHLLTALTSPGGLDQPEEIGEIAELFGLYEHNYADIKEMITGDFAVIGQLWLVETDRAGFSEVVPEFLRTRTVAVDALVESVSFDRDESYYGFRDDVKQVVDARADTLAAAAARRARWFQGLAGVAIGVTALATWLGSRSITRPLQSLTRQATVMARDRLPRALHDILDTPLGEDVTVPRNEPIEVDTRDEVADVADALNRVQDSAVELAVEQAVLRRNVADTFANLGRRNQHLLSRQLDLITKLERNEADPDTLANLFRLDHLATRMRRNAESLLVLAGIDPPRRRATPVQLTDVIRAAVGEVEDYRRVVAHAVEPTTIVGTAATDLAHLLAELIENALVFSPPEQTVEVRGRSRCQGYRLAVVDSGPGMSPAAIARANRRLAGTESYTIAPSTYLGHYVAGKLAARHHIAIELQGSSRAGDGITASVHLPADLQAGPVPDEADGAPPTRKKSPRWGRDAYDFLANLAQRAQRNLGHPKVPTI
jgi:signal transduction histidine kinase